MNKPHHAATLQGRFLLAIVAAFLMLLGAATASSAHPMVDPAESAKPPAQQYYAAPNGKPTGDGTIKKPWDLQTAFEQASVIKPGDTLWLRGGTYGKGGSDEFISKLEGTKGRYIAVRQYPGERAIINGSITTIYMKPGSGVPVTSDWIAFWGFEITNTNPERNATTDDRPGGLELKGRGDSAINLFVHDTGHPGIGFWDSVGDGGEVYGNTVWNVGIYDTEQNGNPRGSPFYMQNQSGARYVADNITFDNFTTGMKAYTEQGYINGFVFRGNVAFSSPQWNIFVAAETHPINKVVLDENFTYQDPGNTNASMQIGYFPTLQGQATITDNYLVNPNLSLLARNVRQLTVTGNTFVSANLLEIQNPANYQKGQRINSNNYFVSGPGNPNPFRVFDRTATVTGQERISLDDWQKTFRYDRNSSLSEGEPEKTMTCVRANKYEPGRGYIVVYNWEQQKTASVDLASLLKPGTAYRIFDVQNMYGKPVAVGTYSGGRVNVPLTLKAVQKPVGDVAGVAAANSSKHTSSTFNAFLVLPVIKPGTALATPTLAPATAAAMTCENR